MINRSTEGDAHNEGICWSYGLVVDDNIRDPKRVGDSYFHLIPTDKNWQPSREAAAAAVDYVARLFAGPADDVERVDHEFHDRITLIDAGEYTTQITCPRCEQDISLSWFGDLIRERGASFDDLNAEVPCCGAVIPLDTLRYDSPVGFARFAVTAMNATRDKYELDDQELADVADILGHSVTQILAHY